MLEFVIGGCAIREMVHYRLDPSIVKRLYVVRVRTELQLQMGI